MVDDTTFKLSTANARIGQGKTIYPSSHPRFFEDLFFDSPDAAECDVTAALEGIEMEDCGSSPWSTTKTFSLEQILGRGLLGEEQADEVRFTPDDLNGKDYYLVTMPLKERPRKYSSYAAERLAKKRAPPPSPSSFTDDVTEKLYRVTLHANATFSSSPGGDDNKVLRGRWAITGEKKEQIRLHTSRFGFGKISANTYGSGNEDKSYWGALTRKDDDGSIVCEEGCILAGLGLEPTTIGSFRLLEIVS